MSPKHLAFIEEIQDDLKATLLKALDYIQWEKHVQKDSVVFGKPNFTFPYYKEGITTDPVLLKCLLELLKSRADRVILGESDGGNHSFKAEDAFAGHDMYEICREAGVELVNLSKLPSVYVEDKILSKNIKVQLPKLLLEEVDCFISVPVLKVHVMTTITLSMKNLWGCFPDTMRCFHHQGLDYKLPLITKCLKPKIVIIDGIYALNNHGPIYGEAVPTNLIIASDNPVAADALGTRIMGFSPAQIGHILVAEKAGLGSTKIENMQINNDWQHYRKDFYIKRTLLDNLSKLPFNSDLLAKIIYKSPLTSLVYKIVGLLRTQQEKEAASQMKNQGGRK
jgi:uncharacterized protein (DUF362 family)